MLLCYYRTALPLPLYCSSPPPPPVRSPLLCSPSLQWNSEAPRDEPPRLPLRDGCELVQFFDAHGSRVSVPSVLATAYHGLSDGYGGGGGAATFSCSQSSQSSTSSRRGGGAAARQLALKRTEWCAETMAETGHTMKHNSFNKTWAPMVQVAAKMVGLCRDRERADDKAFGRQADEASSPWARRHTVAQSPGASSARSAEDDDMEPALLETMHSAEVLQAGDVVFYLLSLYGAGDVRGHTQARVVEVDPDGGERVLALDNNETLDGDALVKIVLRAPDCKVPTFVPHDGGTMRAVRLYVEEAPAATATPTLPLLLLPTN